MVEKEVLCLQAQIFHKDIFQGDDAFDQKNPIIFRKNFQPGQHRCLGLANDGLDASNELFFLKKASMIGKIDDFLKHDCFPQVHL